MRYFWIYMDIIVTRASEEWSVMSGAEKESTKGINRGVKTESVWKNFFWRARDAWLWKIEKWGSPRGGGFFVCSCFLLLRMGVYLLFLRKMPIKLKPEKEIKWQSKAREMTKRIREGFSHPVQSIWKRKEWCGYTFMNEGGILKELYFCFTEEIEWTGATKYPRILVYDT